MIKIIDLDETTKPSFIKLCLEFYNTPAVIHKIPENFIENTANEAIKKNPFLRCLIIKENEDIVGYLLLSLTYSNEVGGNVLLLEEIYIVDKCRGKGIGKKVFDFIFENYKDKVKRYRLEVTKENIGAISLYKRLCFNELDYKQMILDNL